MSCRGWWRRCWALLVMAGVMLAGSAGPVQAGDPWRYADRSEWPDWAVEYFPTDTERQYPVDGELVDAIRFELIRGYPVESQDYMGYEDREFRPYQAMTRAEFAAVLSRSQGLASEDGEDVWYAPYVAALRETGIIPPDASEAWQEPISRREAGRWMGRAAELFDADEREDVPAFVDVDDPLILRALRAGIVKGTGQGRYEPDRPLLRVEAAVMLLRLARARNRNVEPGLAQRLQDIIKEADRLGTVDGKRWVELGYIDGVDDGGIMTREFTEYLEYWAREAVETKQSPPTAWSVVPEETYEFEVLEVHETVAVIKSCGVEHVYRPTDPEGEPWFENPYCERQFFVKRGDQWFLSAAY